jgi:hypothetical protein
MLPKKTFGLLDIDGQFFSHVLEDEDRYLELHKTAKVLGETAIPRGIYPVVLDFSARFKKTLPHVLGVPGFDGIRIHSGNTASDTHGCLLVGDVRTPSGISQSAIAMARLMDKLMVPHLRKELITLEVK